MKVGDKVKITEYYLSMYPNWNVADKIGTVLEVTQGQIFAHNLGAIDLARFVARHGKQQAYPVIGMLVQIDEDKFLVSDFGFQVVPEVSKKKLKSKK